MGRVISKKMPSMESKAAQTAIAWEGQKAEDFPLLSVALWSCCGSIAPAFLQKATVSVFRDLG